MNHTLKMLLGCMLPLLLIFILPLLGVSQGVVVPIFIVLMFACHLFMMGGHGHAQDESTSSGGIAHEHHQH